MLNIKKIVVFSSIFSTSVICFSIIRSHRVIFPRGASYSMMVSNADFISWSTDAVPCSYPEVADLMASSVKEAIETSRTSSSKLLSVDVLTPGLNPKLEQKAMLMQEYLFDLVASIIRVTESVGFRSVPLMFPSAGDAAGFQKYCGQVRFPIPDNVRLTDVGLDRISPADDCVVFITAKNHIGDPVIREIQKITADNPDRICLFLNCDLSDRVTSGISDRKTRDAYRSNIQPAFYFRNIVQIIRPSLIPLELGAMLYRPSTKWEILAINEKQIVGPGSLNRYMKVPVFAKDPKDPTVFNPPEFTLAARFEQQPKRDEIDSAMARIAFKVAKQDRDLERSGAAGGRPSMGLGSGEQTQAEIKIDTVADAVKILDQAIWEKNIDASVIGKAIIYLETKSTLSGLNALMGSSSGSSINTSSTTMRVQPSEKDNSPSLMSLGDDRPAAMGVFDINSGSSSAVTVPSSNVNAGGSVSSGVRTDAQTSTLSTGAPDEDKVKWSTMWLSMLAKLTGPSDQNTAAAWESVYSLSVRAGNTDMQEAAKEMIRFQSSDTTSGTVEKSGLFGVQSSSGRYSASVLPAKERTTSFPSELQVTCNLTEKKMFGFLGGGGGGEGVSVAMQLMAVGQRMALVKTSDSEGGEKKYQLWRKSV